MQLAADGDVDLLAQDIKLDIAQSSRDENSQSASSKRSGLHAKASASASSSQSQTVSQVSSITAGGALSAQALQDLTLVGAQISAQGDLTLSAGRDLNIGAAENSQSYAQQQQSKKSGLSMDFMNGLSVGSAKQGQNGSGSQTTVVGASLSGANILLQSGRDATLTAATVLADGDISVNAGRDLNILAAQQGQASDQQSKNSGTSIGLMPGLSARFTLFGQNAVGHAACPWASGLHPVVGAPSRPHPPGNSFGAPNMKQSTNVKYSEA